ncbi:MAG: hypothetical protein ACJAZ3_001053 [Sphingobacteriales bacterium]|jgi:uncharacterized protein YdcH (DUF465 family)
MTVIIINTPYHLSQLTKLVNEIKIDNDIVIFYGQNIDNESILSNFPKAKLVNLPAFKISYSAFLKSPISLINSYRNVSKQYSSIVYSSLKNVQSVSNMILFSSKDVFTQILLNYTEKKKLQPHVIAIDEGIAYYVKNNFNDYLKKIIYFVLTPLIFGFRYTFYKTANAEHPLIKTVYARLPEMMVRRKGVEYIKIKTTQNCANREIQKSNKILVLTGPFSEDALISINEESQMFQNLFDELNKLDVEIYVKAHPRENTYKYQKFENLKYLNQKMLAEEIDFFEYEKIVQFGSSIIFNLLTIDYPKKRIYTIFLIKQKELRVFFEGTNCKFDRNLFGFFTEDNE